jgi:5-methylcytosine-specific restriction endonuclease McrA
VTDPIYGQTSMKSCLGCSRSFEVPRYARQTPSRCPKCRGKAWSRRPPANSYAYGSGWAARARQVLKRDGYRCQLRFGDICIGKASQVDHIVQPEAGGGSDLANLRAVCRPCHARRTGRQGALAKQRAAQRRNPR